MLRPRLVTSVAVLLAVATAPLLSQRGSRKPLSPAEIDAVTDLVRLEDTRQFDEATLVRLVKSTHPEVRRRAVIAVGRIVNPAGAALLRPLQSDPDPEIVATVAFAYGQLKDAESVPWLSFLITSKQVSVAREAARSLGKIRSPEARTALARYLTDAPVAASASPVVGEALLSLGRFTTRDDITPLVRWIGARDAEIRWRAAWGLFRPAHPDAVPHLLKLSADPSPDVRFWAVRGLVPDRVKESGLDAAKASARLREAVRDTDRRVRTEALRVLGNYDDDESLRVVLEALESNDSWMSVSAAESLTRFQSRGAVVVPRLVAAAGPARSVSLRITALTPLVALAPDAALDVANSLLGHTSLVARASAVQALQKLGPAGRARLDALAADPATKSLVPQPGGNRGARPDPPKRPLSDYRRIVDRWIVTDYNGAKKPRAVLTTPRGEIELELYPGDAPLGVEYFISVVESGAIVGTEFGRVVPNFVAQQRTIPTAVTLRDEVSSLGLTRGNLSWASAGLDTGRPGYTLGSTPQPHNEGNFTPLGRVVRGMDVVDRLELGDAITEAKIIK